MLREQHRGEFIRQLPAMEKEDFAGYLIRTMEELCILLEQQVKGKLYLDDCMYTLNGEALAFYRKLGVSGFTASAELNRKELAKRDNRDSEICIYGRQILMVSAQCLQKNTVGCDHGFGTLVLKDRKGVKFPAKCCCDFCYNILYNSIPLGLVREVSEIKKEDFAGYRLSFTTENGRETTDILNLFAAAYQGEMPTESPGFTRGHYLRGVE